MKALIHAPLFKFAICFVLGILSAEHLGLLPVYIGIPALLIFCLSILIRSKRVSLWRNHLIAIMVYLIAFGLGAGRQQVSTPFKEADALEDVNCQQIYLVGHLVSAVKTNEWGKKAWMDISAIQIDSLWEKRSGRIQLYFASDMNLDLEEHDSLLVLASLHNIQSPHPSYLTYLHRNRVFYGAYVKAVTEGNPRHGIQYISQSWQIRLSHKIRSLISDPDLAGIAQAMFLGDKSGLNPEVREVFAGAGLSHILAISGLHIGIIFMILTKLCSPFHLMRYGLRIKHLLVLGLLILYMFLTGCGPAVVRAVLMLGAVLLFRIGYQRYHLLNLIAIAAIVQLFVDPQQAWQAGFQLSYSAVIGIVLLLPIYERWVKCELNWLNKVYSGIGVTVIATTATTPFVWMYFGQFPTYFLLSNLLVTSLSFLVVFCGFLLVLCSHIPLINELLGICVEGLLRLLYEIALWITSLPHAVLTNFEWDHPAIGIILIQLACACGFILLPKISLRPRLSPVLTTAA
ncbi:MAG: ComEC/Rec2 family competence protein [Bacteroidota bacterium]